MLRSLRIALRTLLRRPTFTAIAILTLALGIGATTAIFTVVDSVAIQPLPYHAAGELVRVQHPVPRLNQEWRWGVSEAGFFALREANETLQDIAVYSSSSSVLAGEGVAERAEVAAVSANLFDVLGARPAVGRLLQWEDNQPGGGVVVVLSHDFWRAQFDADPSVVGRTLELDGWPREVVGVAEPGFGLPEGPVDLWVAVSISAANEPVNWHRFSSVARLRPGVSLEGAEADLNRIVATFAERLPNAYGGGFMEESGFTAEVVGLRDHVVGDVTTALWVLLGAVGIVLLIGCLNVANLFLVRMEAARKETAVRVALGASRRDLALKSLSESLLLGAAAAVGGLLLAWSGLALILSFSPDLPRIEEIALGRESILFTALVALTAAAVFGLMPVLRRTARMEGLKEGVGLTPSGQRNAVRGALVVGEVALALVLLVGAGLMIRTFQSLRSVDPGLDPEGVLTVAVSLPTGHYRDYDRTGRFYRELLDRVERMPGVVAAGATTKLPLASATGCATMVVDEPEAQERMTGCFADPILATPGYFAAMGIPVDGTVSEWSEMEARRGGVVVTRAFADRVWRGERAIGRGVKGNARRPEPPFYTVLGVTGDLRAEGLAEPSTPQVYFPMFPAEGTSLWMPPRSMVLAVRTTSGRPGVLATPVREAIQELEPGAAVGQVLPMTEIVAASMARTSFAMLLLGIAAAVALALGMIGLYGVISYVVEQRRREIGIRMALGARAIEVKWLVVAQAAKLTGFGIAIGVAGALLTSRVLASQLHGVRPNDPLTLVGVAVLLGAVAVAAAYIPASRAAAVEPMGVLRSE